MVAIGIPPLDVGNGETLIVRILRLGERSSTSLGFRSTEEPTPTDRPVTNRIGSRETVGAMRNATGGNGTRGLRQERAITGTFSTTTATIPTSHQMVKDIMVSYTQSTSND